MPSPAGTCSWRTRLSMRTRFSRLLGLPALALVVLLGAFGGSATAAVEIRRTADGIPHVLASGWRELGYGYGHAQAEDALCTLAEAFVTYRGQRSFHFGGEGRPARNSTFGRSTNLELDFFFCSLVADEQVAAYRQHQPADLQALTEGFAAGYNAALRQLKAQQGPQRRACAGESWVAKISADDIYRRMYAAGLAGGYSRFIPQIVNARPPGGPDTGALADDVAERLAHAVGEMPGLGSNVIALGREATGEEAGVLFGNPHWFWGGPDRFYQAHLTIPGRLNVAGVSFLGVPVIVIGFNEHIAWSHTVSAARRFGLFELALDAADPTAYRYDGAVEKMQRRQVAVEVRQEDGSIATVTRALYRSRQGPLVDFGARSPAFAWGPERALALRDINAGNFRSFETFFRWNQAKSLDEFAAIQREEGGVPWVNTVAIGRGDGRVWFADIGAVPNVPDALRQRCAGALAPAFATLDRNAPLLDGSRADCAWATEPAAPVAGSLPPARMPALFATDYVANMNDSYWFTRPAQPLEGYDRILGGEGEELSLRGQAGHALGGRLLHARAGSARELARMLRREVLDARVHSAIRFKQALLAAACVSPTVTVKRDLLSGEALASPVEVNTAPACRLLAGWQDKGGAEDRGSLLWDAWWARLRRIPAAEFYRVPFDRTRPLDTPAGPAAADPRVAEALGAAILAQQKAGLALDARRGSALTVDTARGEVALFGGCDLQGYFTVACAGAASYRMNADSHGNSYLQVVRFVGEGAAGRGVEAHTLLPHGNDERALQGGPGAAPVLRYARQDWLRFPFTEAEIAADPALRRIRLHP